MQMQPGPFMMQPAIASAAPPRPRPKLSPPQPQMGFMPSSQAPLHGPGTMMPPPRQASHLQQLQQQQLQHQQQLQQLQQAVSWGAEMQLQQQQLQRPPPRPVQQPRPQQPMPRARGKEGFVGGFGIPPRISSGSSGGGRGGPPRLGGQVSRGQAMRGGGGRGGQAVALPRPPRAAEPSTVVGEVRNDNYKSKLNELVMRLSGRPLSSGDVLYSMKSNLPRLFQAAVKVATIHPATEFEGDVKARKRDAEQSAAQRCLEYYASKVGENVDASLRISASKAAAGGVALGDADGSKKEESRLNFKSTLNEIVTKVLRRPMTAQDVIYVTNPTAGNQFSSSVTVPAIDASREFSGDAKSRKKDAEQSAAEKAASHYGSQTIASMQISASGAAAALPAAAARSPGGVASGAASSISLSASTGDKAAFGNYKSILNEMVMRQIGRPLAKGDVSYVANAVTGGFLATVEVPAISPGLLLEGQAKATKKEAEQTAAKVAVEKFEEAKKAAPPPLKKA